MAVAVAHRILESGNPDPAKRTLAPALHVLMQACDIRTDRSLVDCELMGARERERHRSQRVVVTLHASGLPEKGDI